MPLLADGLSLTSQENARVYFAAQAAGGAIWWVAVFVSADVRRWTLGDWTRGRHLLRSLVQLVVFWPIFFLLVPYVLATIEQRLRIGWPALDHPTAHWSGAIAFVVASGLRLWSCVSMALHG